MGEVLQPGNVVKWGDVAGLPSAKQAGPLALPALHKSHVPCCPPQQWPQLLADSRHHADSPASCTASQLSVQCSSSQGYGT